MNLYLRIYQNRVFVDSLRILIIFDEIIKLEYQVGIIKRIFPHPKYLLIEERFIKLLTNNIPTV